MAALRVAGAWEGWQGETLVQLTDGSWWRQTEYVYEYRYSYRPKVVVRDGRMVVEGMSRSVRVTRLSGVTEAVISGEWTGWDGSTTVTLTDGSKWAQAEYHYEYHYAYQPTVIFVGDVMHVEGMTQGVRVRPV